MAPDGQQRCTAFTSTTSAYPAESRKCIIDGNQIDCTTRLHNPHAIALVDTSDPITIDDSRTTTLESEMDAAEARLTTLETEMDSAEAHHHVREQRRRRRDKQPTRGAQYER